MALISIMKEDAHDAQLNTSQVVGDGLLILDGDNGPLSEGEICAMMTQECFGGNRSLQAW
jgi:hypothetical protein